MKKPFIVGITGGSASGKSFFLKSLVGAFASSDLTLISQDHYYKPKEQQPLDRNGVHNFDTPSSIDDELLTRDIEALLAGNEVQRLEYTFNNPSITPEKIVFQPAPLIIVEGLFAFYYPKISNLLDLKIYVDAKEYIKLSRRITRDKVERGYEIEDVLYRYENHVAPMYEKYIKPFKNDADIIIPNNSSFDKALEILVVYLKSKL
ncbi:MAG TPA: uridine kinase [Cytophagaceae bacterium]|jgi:uridine kinase